MLWLCRDEDLARACWTARHGARSRCIATDPDTMGRCTAALCDVHARMRCNDSSNQTAKSTGTVSGCGTTNECTITIITKVCESACAPAARIVASRAAGSLSGQPSCAPPSSSSAGSVLSSISPWLADTRRSAASSSGPITPALTCGSKLVSRKIAAHTCCTYSSVVAKPSCCSSARASAYSSSGLSPSVSSASVQPAASPCFATASTSSTVMNAAWPARGGCAKVQ